MNITLVMRESKVGDPPLEFPMHSISTFWTDDRRIGVVVGVRRADGGIHLIQDIIDPPTKETK